MQAKSPTPYKNVRRRGMTLTEITVVLAIVAIVAALVSTYVIMLAQRLRTATATLNAMQDISVATRITEDFIDTAAKDIRGIKLGNPTNAEGTPSSNTLKNTEGAEEYSLTYIDGTLSVTYPHLDDDITFKSDVITDIRFYTDDGNLFFVTVTYNIPISKTEFREETFTFTVNSYIGETV